MPLIGAAPKEKMAGAPRELQPSGLVNRLTATEYENVLPPRFSTSRVKGPIPDSVQPYPEAVPPVQMEVPVESTSCQFDG
jgi:hypothetical protein